MYNDTAKNELVKDKYSGKVETSFDINSDNTITGNIVFRSKYQGWDVKFKASATGTFDPKDNKITIVSEEKSIKYEGVEHKVKVEISAQKRGTAFIGEKDITVDGITITMPFNAIVKV